jgi:hypothetical protein
MKQNQNQQLKEKRSDRVYKAETKDGRSVTNLRLTDAGWVGCVDGFKTIWDHHGITGNGSKWNLFNIR